MWSAASAVVGDVKLYICGVIDIEKERARLMKQRDQNLKEIQRFEKKLGNEGFVAKAPASVVEKERAKLADAQASRAVLAEQRDKIAAL